MGIKDKVYKYDRKIKNVLEKIENSNIDECNKETIRKFHRDSVIRGLSKGRILKSTDTLYRLTKWLDKPFEETTKEDIKNIVHHIETNGYSDWTKHDYKVILRIFFRWFKETETYPDIVKWINTKHVTKKKLPEELLSPEEIKRIVDGAPNLRDKAFLLVLYESGCRIGEILTLKIKHVQFDEYGAVLIVNGKTGQRRVRLVISASKLNQWIENHPLKNDNEAPLWVTLGTSNRNKPASYNAMRLRLKVAAKRAGIKKRVYPHLFRHSRATHLANELTEAQMKQFFGWVQASEMASIYVHLSGRDVDKALLRINGIEVPESKKGSSLQALICPRCNNRNSPDAKFCSMCGMCLDAKTAVELEKTREKADELMSTLVKNPKVIEVLTETVQEITQ